MGKRELRRGAILLGGTHFLVDLCCTAALTALALRSSVQRVLLCAILYNGLAFAFQLPIGALADRLQLSRSLCAFGCLLVAVAGFFAPPILVTVLLGLGNACFHVGGGREALHRGGEKAAFVGYFVAPGAMGIFLGPLCAKAVSAFAYIAAAPLLLCAFLLFVSRREGKKAEKLQLRARPFHTLSALLIMGCMFLTVLLRSYMGSILHYPFQGKVIFSALFVLAIVGGKFCGGVLADRFGAFSFTLWAQLCAVLLFVLSLWLPCCAYPAIFLFNTTMAVTAHRLYTLCPNMGGTMFGLTTFALYLGAMPGLLKLESPFFNLWGLLLLGLLSTGLLLLGLRLGREAQNA